MGRRHRHGRESSLELLLDTICNTFGAVLFLAMLVSLLLAQTRRRSDSDEARAEPRAALSPADLARLRMAADQIAAEVDRLQLAVRQDRVAAAEFATSGVEAAAAALDEAEQSRDRLHQEHRRVLWELASAQAATARARAAAAEGARVSEDAERAVAAARTRLKEVIEDRRRLLESAVRLRDVDAARATVQTTGRAPRERSTEKSEFGVMLRYGRLYLMKVPRGGSLVVNEDEFFVEPGEVRNVARPKPHEGLDLSNPDSLGEPLGERLRSFPAAAWYPCLVVHPDSFDAFCILKPELVARGYEYRLLPTATSVVDRGGQGAVQ